MSDIYDQEPIKDKAQPKDWKDLMSKYREIKRQDIIAVVMKLFDKPLIWYHTNIQNNQHLDRILQTRTWCDLHTAQFDIYQTIPDDLITKKEKTILSDFIKATNTTVLNLTENYAEIRKSAKGLTSKQIERITAGIKSEPKDLDKIFKKGEKQQ